MQAQPFFTQQLVRDLYWACFGPNIIDDFSFAELDIDVQPLLIELTEERLEWLNQLDRQPEPLQQYIDNLKSPRLGIYFEALWQFFLQHDQRLELIAHNLPIYRNKKTYGEFDIILLDKKTNSHTHLELSTKYYLNSSLLDRSSLPPLTTSNDDDNRDNANQQLSADFSHWLGPNANDRLDKKINRLLSHQIAMSSIPEGKQALQELDIAATHKRIVVKGMLFYPQQNTATQARHKERLSVHHQYGHWHTLASFINTQPEKLTWQVLDKSLWISPTRLGKDEAEKLLSGDSLHHYLDQYFKHEQRPIMLGQMKEDTNGFTEQQRVFVTNDQWPIFKPRSKNLKISKIKSL